jgi:4-aminobutyrate aminotransferase-like enzyme/Ser/Thr protein kinase RdoA (MazF antagonist)
VTDTAQESVHAALKPFGLEAMAVTPLSGYHDECYRVDTNDGQFVMKIAPDGTARDLIDFETSVVEHALSIHPHLPLPRYRPASSGTAFATVTLNGHPRHARLLTFLPGNLFADFKPKTGALREELGRILGQLDRALLEYRHAAMERVFEWDLARAPNAARMVGGIRDDERRGRIQAIFDRHADIVEPAMAGLRKSVIHADANDYNILVGCGSDGTPMVTGLLDFGDTVLTQTVNEVAIACAYVMLDEADPVGAACDLIRGYNSVLRIEEDELELLFTLILTRLAMSSTYSALWSQQHPDHSQDAYHTVSEDAVWRLLDQLEKVHSDFAHYAFRDACGLTPCTRSAAVVDYLTSATGERPVLACDLVTDPVCIIDLSVASTNVAAQDDTGDAVVWSKLIADQINDAGAIVGIGRYNEARACYTAAQFGLPGREPRTIHLGIDLFAPAGSPVLAPFDATIHSLRDNDLDLDYGPTVILEHRLSDDESFHTLYGHLSRASLGGLQPGQALARGEPFAQLGESTENGGWPPHLHIQIVTNMLGMEGNFPGVAEASRRTVWTSICPDPNLILRIPRTALPAARLESADVLRLRRKHIGSNVGLSYRSPLHIVRGRGAYLFDIDGRRYLDCVNNVAHVGHSHLRVVRAIADQAAVLNTNTRYLHEGLVRYAERLTATLPEPLRVCFLVNSGSEANDLALRMALAHTGGTDFVVLGAAYHGHLTSLIEISPYKSRGPGGAAVPSHVHEIPAPDSFRGPHATSPDPARSYADEIQPALVAIQDAGRRVAALIAESALSCAGQIMLPDGYLASIYEQTRSAGGVCIADEVQVGFGRVGTHFWAFETQDVVPDIVTMGKPMGNGHPLGAVVTTADIAASFANGMEYFNTYGGNPVSCAAGLAVLDVIRDDRLQGHALRTGRTLVERLSSLAAEHPVLGDVRGSGLFIGVEIVAPGTRQPAPWVASYIINRMRDLGVLLSTDGPDHNVLKIKPPMVFNDDDVTVLTDRLAEVLGEHYIMGQDAR